MYNQLKRTIKTKYYTDLFERRKHDIRKTWQIRNSLVRDRSNKSTFPYNFRMHNQKWTYPKTSFLTIIETVVQLSHATGYFLYRKV